MTDDPRDLRTHRPRGEPFTFDFEGSAVRAYGGEPVAVALWAAGISTLARSSKYHRPRGLFCLEGHCNSCYLRIDGRPNLRSCLAPARPGSRCERQNAFPNVDADVLAAADWMFPRGMDHHTLLTRSRVANRMFIKLVRQMGGSGTLPDAAPSEIPEIADHAVDVAVVGAGPAGLAAARAAAEAAAGSRVALYDEQDLAGGSLLAQPGGVASGAALAAAARAAGAEINLGAAALAFYPEDGAGTLAVLAPDGLRRVTARRFVYATGGYDQNLPFVDNDRPGILSARACGRLAFRFGIRPGRRVVVLDNGSDGRTLAGDLGDLGVEVERVEVGSGVGVRARGLPRVRGLEISEPGKNRRIVKADVVAVASTPAPASELPRQHGADVRMDVEGGGFAVVTDAATGRTTADGVFACGDVTGYRGPARALEDGARVGRAAAENLP